jgi:hypothetical protein
MAKKEVSLEAADARFGHYLGLLTGALKYFDIEYSLVGGLARKHYIGKPIHGLRPNGTHVDIDGVEWTPHRDNAHKFQKAVSEMKKGYPDFPEVGIEPTVFSDEPVRGGPLTMLTTMRVDSNSNFSMDYKGLSVRLPPETMQTSTICINDVPFYAFCASTQYFRALIRNPAGFKEKDQEELALLKNYILNHPTTEPCIFNYLPYRILSEKMQSQFPVETFLVGAYWHLDHKIFNGAISGAKGIIYKSIDLFHS